MKRRYTISMLVNRKRLSDVGSGPLTLNGIVATCCLTSLLSACASTAGSIPVDQFSDNQDPPGEYTIGVGDMLSIQVFDQEKMSARMRVRSDGRITLQLVNDIEASDKTPAKLAADIESALKALVLNPRVTVIVEESSPMTISVLGEVGMAGLQQLQRGAGVAQALASAGGLTHFAHKDRIFVVRNIPKPIRIHFTYDQLTKKVGRASSFLLRPGDVVVVE
jgi:polysaccharide export outer membrane protein